jgi:hypothetical protein
MAIPKDMKERAQLTRVEGVSLAMFVEFAQDMFPGASTEDNRRLAGERRRARGLGPRWRSNCS